MKVIKNGRGSNHEPKQITCEGCHSEIEYTSDDLDYGAFGCGEITCPVCGKQIDIDDASIDLTCENIEFPKHFMDNKGSIKLDDADVRKYVRECLKSAMNDKENDWGTFYRSGTGDSEIIVLKYEEEYDILVAKNTWCCVVPRD